MPGSRPWTVGTSTQVSARLSRVAHCVGEALWGADWDVRRGVRLRVSGVEELIGRFLREHRPSHALPRRVQVRWSVLAIRAQMERKRRMESSGCQSTGERPSSRRAALHGVED